MAQVPPSAPPPSAHQAVSLRPGRRARRRGRPRLGAGARTQGPGRRGDAPEVCAPGGAGVRAAAGSAGCAMGGGRAAGGVASGRAQIKGEARGESALGRPCWLRLPAVPSPASRPPVAPGSGRAEPGCAQRPLEMTRRPAPGAAPRGKAPGTQAGRPPPWGPGTCGGQRRQPGTPGGARGAAGGAGDLGPGGDQRRKRLAPGLVRLGLNRALCVLINLEAQVTTSLAVGALPSAKSKRQPRRKRRPSHPPPGGAGFSG